jgi:hypothetical protein
MKNFDEANKKMHSVKDQWHYETMIEHGFTPITKEAQGFVRSYKYKNKNGKIISCRTGCSGDYWVDEDTKDYGYHRTLTPYLEKISNR